MTGGKQSPLPGSSIHNGTPEMVAVLLVETLIFGYFWYGSEASIDGLTCEPWAWLLGTTEKLLENHWFLTVSINGATSFRSCLPQWLSFGSCTSGGAMFVASADHRNF